MENTVNRRKSLSEVFQKYEDSVDKAHSSDHIFQVLQNAVAIAREYPAIPLVEVGYAAILHDIAREDDFKNGTDIHEIRGAEISYEYTSHLDKAAQNRIADAIRNHRNSNGNPITTLAKIISDADRIPASWTEYVARTYLYNYSMFGDYRLAIENGYESMVCKYRDKEIRMYTDKGKAMVAKHLKIAKERINSLSDYEEVVELLGLRPI